VKAMNSRRVTLIVAVVLALGTGLLTLNYLRSVQQTAAPPPEAKTVVVAARDIQARSKITEDMLTVTKRAASEVEPDAISDPKLAVGSIALITIPTNGSIIQSKIGHPADLGLPARLKPGQRAISIPIDRVRSVSGLIQPGDHVDIIAVPPRGAQDSTPRGYAFLRDITVLALGGAMETASATPSPDGGVAQTITFAVTPQQADELTAIDLNAQLRLALRPPNENTRSEEVEAVRFPTEAQPHIAAAAPNVAPPPVAAAAPGAPVPKTVGSSVMMIDGDKVVSAP
jgi:pilus assembly protein CpaB